MGTTLEGIQLIQGYWKYMICAKNGDLAHAFLFMVGSFSHNFGLFHILLWKIVQWR